MEQQARAVAEGNLNQARVLDLQFHQSLMELANNKRLLRMWQNVAVQCAMAFHYHTVTLPDYDHMQGKRDHVAILNALRSGEAANVHAGNQEINARVARQCIEGRLGAGEPRVERSSHDGFR